MLRHEGYSGPITMLSDDDAPPCDRPNLSKDYLAGNAPEEWIPLRLPEFYDQHEIELRLGTRVVAVHPIAREGSLLGSRRYRKARAQRVDDGTPFPLEIEPGSRPDLPIAAEQLLALEQRQGQQPCARPQPSAPGITAIAEAARRTRGGARAAWD
jgi:hypothetical protein